MRNLFRKEKETKAIKDYILEYLEILRIFLSMKKKKIIINQLEWAIFGVTIILNLIEYESKGDGNKTLLVKEYLNKIRPLLKFLRFVKDIMYNLKRSDTWKIELTKTINFMSSIDNNEKLVMHSRSDNIEIMIHDGANNIIKNLLIYSKIDIKMI